MAIKASDNFQFSKTWWSKNKPLTLKSTGLGEALGAYEAILVKVRDTEAKGTYNGTDGAKLPFEKAVSHLQTKVSAAVKKAFDSCSKTMHADCIAVLNKFNAAKSTEVARIANAEKQFLTAYLTNTVKPLNDRAKLRLGQLKKGVTESATRMAVAEKEAGVISKLRAAIGKSTPDAAQKAYFDCLRRLNIIDQGQKALTKLADDAETQLTDLTGQDGSTVLSKVHRMTQVKLIDQGTAFRNQILKDYNRIRGMFANAQGDVEFMAGAFDGQKIDIKSQTETLKSVSSALMGMGEDSRRINNNFTGWLLSTRLMIQAQQQAGPNGDLVKVAKKMSIAIPVKQWKSTCLAMKKKVAGLIADNANLLKKATETRNKAIARIPTAQKKDATIKTLIDELNEYVKEISDYQGTTKAHADKLDNDLTTLGFI